MSRLQKKLKENDLDFNDLFQDEIEDRILSPEDEKKKRTQNILAVVAGVLAVAILGGTMFFSGNNNGSKKEGNSQTNAGLYVDETATAVTNPNESNDFEVDKYPEITELIQLYYKAKLTGDTKSIQKYVDNIEEVDMNKIKANNKFIKKYENIECYTKMGLYDNTYVVFVYNEIKFKNIDTTAPAVDILYVIRDEETGFVYIHNGVTANNDIKNYILALEEDKDVKELIESTNNALKSAVENDSNLKDMYKKLQEASAEETTKKKAESKNSKSGSNKSKK